jgi:triosephosphate isomerase
MSRKSFVGGNWKSYNDPAKVKTLVDGLSATEFPVAADVLIAPTYIYLDRVNSALGSKFLVSAQNCSLTNDGAFTGEISAKGLKDFGLNWVILGHSERRALFGESNSVVGDKVSMALSQGLSVVACVGETLEDRNANKTNDVVAAQLEAIAAGVAKSGSWSSVVLAYEPVWAIGTGVVASPQQAQDTQAFIRSWVADKAGAEVAASVRIIYGGSVKPGNAAELYQQRDIDGFLVGGASLVAEDFKNIVAATTQSKL